MEARRDREKKNLHKGEEGLSFSGDGEKRRLIDKLGSLFSGDECKNLHVDKPALLFSGGEK